MTERPSLNRNMMAVICGVGIDGEALRVAMRHQAYQVHASAMGVSPAEAERVLGEVVTELSQTAAPGDAFDIARNRIAAGGDAFRPSAELRNAARDMLGAHGYSTHPEVVDFEAWRLQRVVDSYAPVRERWYKRWWRRLRKILRRPARRTQA